MKKLEKISPVIMGIFGIVLIVDVFLEQFFNIGTKQNSLTIMYCISFVLLSLHLLHGFSSSLKSIGTNKSYASSVKNLSYIYSIGIPLGFCFIAIFHYYTH